VLEEGLGLGFIVLSGDTRSDDGEFREWQRELRLEAGKKPAPKPQRDNEKPPSRRGRKYGFRPLRLDAFLLPDVEALERGLHEGYIKEFAQGRQASLASRKPKYQLKLGLAEPIRLATRSLNEDLAKVEDRSRAKPVLHPVVGRDEVVWQYGPTWLSDLWGIPVSSSLDLRRTDNH